VKTSFFMCFCLLISIAGTSHANVTGLWVLSQEYHISGWCEGDTGRISYNITSHSPISQTITTTGTYPGYFVAHPYSHSAADLFYAEAFAVGSGEFQGYVFPAQAYAEATWVFQPTTSSLQATFSTDFFPGHHDGYFEGNLINLTTGDEVTNYVLDWQNEEWGAWLYEFDPAHQYKLHVSFSPGQDWGEGYYVKWSAEFEPGPAIIPAPGGLVLAIIGVSCASCLRRWKSRK
jgi:hypothetical protein